MDNFGGYPQPIHIFFWLIHIFNVVFRSIYMLQYFYIKQNADLIKSFYALGVFKDASELQDVSVVKINLMKLNMGGRGLWL